MSYQGLSCPSPRPSPLFICKVLGAGDPSCPLSPRATKGPLAGRVACVSASPSIFPGDRHSSGQSAPARELTKGGSAVPAGSACLARGRILGFPLAVGRVQGAALPSPGAGSQLGVQWGGRGSGRSGRPSEQRRAVGKSKGVERQLEQSEGPGGGKPLPSGPSAPGTIPAQGPGEREAPSSWALTSSVGAQPGTWQCPAYDRGPQSPLLDGADDDRPTIVSRMTQVAGVSPPRVTSGALSTPWAAVTDDHRWGGVFSQIWRPGPKIKGQQGLRPSEAPGRVRCLTLLTTVPGD